jgi:hypothetical protein
MRRRKKRVTLSITIHRHCRDPLDFCLSTAISGTPAVFPTASGGRHIRGEDLWHKEVAQAVLDSVVTCNWEVLCATPMKSDIGWTWPRSLANHCERNVREISCWVLHMCTQPPERDGYSTRHLMALGKATINRQAVAAAHFQESKLNSTSTAFLTYQIHCQQARGRPRKCGKSDSIVFASCASTRGHPKLWAAHEDATNRMSRRHAVHCESLTVLHTRPVRSRDYAPAPLHFGSMSRLGYSCHSRSRSFIGAPCLRSTSPILRTVTSIRWQTE